MQMGSDKNRKQNTADKLDELVGVKSRLEEVEKRLHEPLPSTSDTEELRLTKQ